MLRHHLGLRTVKTGLAVALALLFAALRNSPAPIFAGIGAIVAMSRTLEDSVRACLTQLAGITCGMVIACVLRALAPVVSVPAAYYAVGGVGIILVILCCNALKLDFAVPLSCIVFTSIWVMDPTYNYLLYGFNRLLDTSIGLVTALVINVGLKPYHNGTRVSHMLTHIQQLFPGYLDARVLRRQYPDLAPLRQKLAALDGELRIFEKQPPPSLLHRSALRAARRKDAAYMRGCQQLLVKMADELSAMCNMDSSPPPSPANCERLALLGLTIPADVTQNCKCAEADIIVLNFHLANLLDAYDFLSDLNRAA
ncbi:MAG: aromatic acid exporter family protein [Intestinibacillus sp.]